MLSHNGYQQLIVASSCHVLASVRCIRVHDSPISCLITAMISRYNRNTSLDHQRFGFTLVTCITDVLETISAALESSNAAHGLPGTTTSCMCIMNVCMHACMHVYMSEGWTFGSSEQAAIWPEGFAMRIALDYMATVGKMQHAV